MASTIAPNQSLYVANLNIQVKKDEMKRALYTLFTAYGRIVDIVHQRSDRMRGVAFVIFRDIQSATTALRGLNGFMFYDRPLKLKYAKRKSKIIALLDGEYNLLANKEAAETEDAMDHDAMEEKESDDESEESEQDEEESEQEAVPHHILFVRNLSKNMNAATLTELFKKHEGFREVRMIPSGTGRVMAFVEYASTEQATVAKDVMHGFAQASGRPMKVTYAKR
ncbi:hypothetical protein SYNPS1DRAFT_24247 [Syncephalis pseudoplumigaleata]|uniref:RRM domain-containing protein n=1 Tax=Syncephalis pseudoplumigaleata TaxID=1712513 RepID=A0A4P9YW45_9FUNG|nr:hypothetical protein SYNPS1DRAFT_24247 [Syncephalis pseudoplumigaleata]|eukprot:RKP23682.1 hypothetical protein SYNPS1DRAFT_24247 [Syncephalis pseudoplumigaleata]